MTGTPPGGFSWDEPDHGPAAPDSSDPGRPVTRPNRKRRKADAPTNALIALVGLGIVFFVFMMHAPGSPWLTVVSASQVLMVLFFFLGIPFAAWYAAEARVLVDRDYGLLGKRAVKVEDKPAPQPRPDRRVAPHAKPDTGNMGGSGKPSEPRFPPLRVPPPDVPADNG
jgi:hypothetical protein